MYKLLCVFFCISSVYASPISELQRVGTGEMNYLFWTIYKADYYIGATEGSLAQDRDKIERSKQAKALEIEYFKSIKSEALIQATTEQWVHLGYSKNEIESWAAPLVNIWPNVEPGNVLLLLIGDDGQSHFYFNDNPIGTIKAETFGPAFLSIWLSENTSEPTLRQQLLGLKP